MEEVLNKIITSKEVEDIGEKVLSEIREKIKEQIADSMYTHLESYLYEHYENHKDKVERELIKAITEEYVKEPSLYKYSALRKKLWEENKEEIIETLTDEAIKGNMENILERYTNKDYHFNWQWKDGIVKVVLENWDKFKDDERIKDGFGRELELKNDRIKSLEGQLEELKQVLE